ncbi:glycosyltransferase family 2 protein [Marinicella sp. S1101]|uniref:glycosyltransferase family 2 protein n=1 Tax=Marinicella marina TaxID=2996016 RepID=UPI002260CFB6|nr:glycosyltransferase family 2 protein [Marinicella marina]MCX7552936.1 glycosyltransferase family 2 protein [Marinicella marina]MDJ1139754.1 glycosyltransferase family 2 protein [Marinicella marina]
MNRKLSIILPAKNEATSLISLLPELKNIQPDAEIIVVNDGSDDETVVVCEQQQVKVVSHPYSRGNGAAIKSGARAATGEVMIFMDADGQHRPEDIEKLLSRYDQGYDMVVGSRGRESQASKTRLVGNGLYNRVASYMTGQKIVDLTSGFRVVNAEKFKQFLYLLPNGFSYPTTITMAFFRAGFGVGYEPIIAPERIGNSHINVLKDGMRFFLIIFKIGTLYSPMKLFFPASMLFFITGMIYYIYTYFTDGRFTNMGVLLLSTSILIFLLGLISEQITALFYQTKPGESAD